MHYLNQLFFRDGQQDPIDVFTTLTNETRMFPTTEKESILEPFYFLLQPWTFCTKNEEHRSPGGITVQRFIEIAKPQMDDGLQQGLEDYFQGGVHVFGWQCSFPGKNWGHPRAPRCITS